MKQRHRKHRRPVRQFQWARRAKWRMGEITTEHWVPIWFDEALSAATDLIIIKYGVNDRG